MTLFLAVLFEIEIDRPDEEGELVQQMAVIIGDIRIFRVVILNNLDLSDPFRLIRPAPAHGRVAIFIMERQFTGLVLPLNDS